MKKLHYILLLAVIACMSLASCSSDDVVKTPLDAPSISQSDTYVSALAFNWQPVSGATQYAYELYQGDALIMGNVTTETSVVAGGLSPNTAYTLKVWAYAATTGDKTTSPIATLTATTNALTPLANPVPQASSANGGVTITWPAVEHANSYLYNYKDADGETQYGIAETNSITLTGLPIGTYTINITATSDDEAYSNSETISLTFERSKAEVWRKTGTYTSAALGESFTADIVAYDDGSYTIEAPYGAEGKDISFSVPEGGTEISPLATEDGGYYSFWVSSEKYVYIYPGSGYSEFTGDKSQGEVWFYTYLYDKDGNSLGGGYDDFTWGSASAELTIDDLCGTYDATSAGTDYFSSDWSQQTVDRTNEVTISKNDDGTLNIYNFYGWEENFTASVDLSAKTVTIQPKSDWGGYYGFAATTSSTTPVVGTISDDGTITFKDFTAWYGEYTYIDEGMTCVMTKK